MAQSAVDYLIEQLQAPCRGIPSHIIEQAKQSLIAQIEAANQLPAAYLREVFESEDAKTWDLVKKGLDRKINSGKSIDPVTRKTSFTDEANSAQ